MHFLFSSVWCSLCLCFAGSLSDRNILMQSTVYLSEMSTNRKRHCCCCCCACYMKILNAFVCCILIRAYFIACTVLCSGSFVLSIGRRETEIESDTELSMTLNNGKHSMFVSLQTDILLCNDRVKNWSVTHSPEEIFGFLENVERKRATEKCGNSSIQTDNFAGKKCSYRWRSCIFGMSLQQRKGVQLMHDFK